MRRSNGASWQQQENGRARGFGFGDIGDLFARGGVRATNEHDTNRQRLDDARRGAKR